jgi:2-amino-4-hydroxy-6-hydroxymethyldihydropteridine diphosphokinase
MRAVIGLGANLGDPRAAFRRAAAALDEGGDRVLARSALFSTRPVGGPPQPDFLNAALLVESARTPRGVLDRILDIERAAGRVRDVRWGPRTLDLDLLWIDGVAVDEPGLQVPHPRLAERAFALAPLLDVAPEARDPRDGVPYAGALARLGGSGVTRLGAW